MICGRFMDAASRPGSWRPSSMPNFPGTGVAVPPNEYHLDLTLGARPSANWLLLLQSSSVISDGSGTGVFDFAYRYYKIQPSVVWNFAPKWSAQLGAVATVAGRNSWREQGVIAGLWRSF